MEETPWRSGRGPWRGAHGGHGEARARKRISESCSSEPDLPATVTCCPVHKGHLSTGPLTPLDSPGEASVSFGCKSPHLPYFMLDIADTRPQQLRGSLLSLRSQSISPPIFTEYLQPQRSVPELLQALQRPAFPGPLLRLDRSNENAAPTLGSTHWCQINGTGVQKRPSLSWSERPIGGGSPSELVDVGQAEGKNIPRRVKVQT